MAGMGFMIAAASRPRDDRGRYAEGDEGRLMEGGYGGQMTMGNAPEMRRRRDSRGRYMEQDGGSRMAYEGDPDRMEYGGEARMWPGPHIPPYLDHPGMRDERNMRPGRERRNAYEEPDMAMGDRYPMRDSNIVHIRDYQDRRKIGFAANRMHDDDDDDEEREQHHGHAKMHDYPMMEQLTEEIATSWVSGLKNTDPEHPIGAKWSMETVKPLAMKHGFTTHEKQLEFWAVMNMMYSDYAETAKKHGVSTLDFYADMAKAWMRDKDAVEHKTAAYIACCTK